MKIFFSDFYNVSPETIRSYGAFNVSLIYDLPLFVDPFLLFNSENEKYQQLHEEIINYVLFLKNESKNNLTLGLIKGWFYFPEVKQNWLGYSKSGNSGRGLGKSFANALKINFNNILKNFGEENGAGTHLEKLTLVKNGVGKDQISDFTCNLIHGFLAEYTEQFAISNISKDKLGRFTIAKYKFNYTTKTWAAKTFTLPKNGADYVLITPIDILTKDENWIAHKDLVNEFSEVLSAVSNIQLRDQINQYFISTLPIEPTKDEKTKVIEKTLEKFPEILDYFIAYKEDDGLEAKEHSSKKVNDAEQLFVQNLRIFVDTICNKTKFYKTTPSSREEAILRINYLKHVIEKQDGYRLFYVNNEPIRKEADLQIMFKLTWFASDLDVNAEVNNGRGPADFVVSYGSKSKSIIEFKLAKNTSLEKNLKNQAEIYSDASRATTPALKVILFFSNSELLRVKSILRHLELENCEDIILIDARNDKPSASKDYN